MLTGTVAGAQGAPQVRVGDVAAQQEGTADQKCGERHPLPPGQGDPGHPEPPDEVDDGREENEEQEAVVPEPVEEVAGDQQQVVLPAVAQAPVGRECTAPCRSDHGQPLLLTKYGR